MKQKTESTKQTSNEIYALLGVVYRQILNLYTSKERYREWMCKPFLINDFVYSTDAHFICRVPKKNIDFKIENIQQKKKKNIDFKIENIQQKKKENIISVYPTERNLNFKIKVEDLKQKSNTVPLVYEYEDTNLQGECNECDGSGYVKWKYDGYYSDFDCPVCNGNGTIRKEKRTKTGAKVKDDTYYIDILSYRLQIPYIDLIVKTAEMLKIDYIIILEQTKNMTLIKISDIELVVIAVNKNIDDDKQNVVFHYA